MSRGILDCLKRERDIFIKPTLSGEKMAFMCTPALKMNFSRKSLIKLTDVKKSKSARRLPES